MNSERIQDLAYDAEDYADTMVDGGSEFHAVFVKKFAELIIRECSEFARQHNLAKAERSYMIHEAIKQHFGVKE